MIQEQKFHIRYQQITMLKLVLECSVVMIILLKALMEKVQEQCLHTLVLEEILTKTKIGD